MSIHGLLATGPADNLRHFQVMVCVLLNPHRQQRDTVHYSCMAEHLEAAKEAAKSADVTLQEIIAVGTRNKRKLDLGNGASCTVSDCDEEYPVLHEGSHGMRWTSEAAK